jgi:glutamate---cysteine ligase / carboxylate-amine ligase
MEFRHHGLEQRFGPRPLDLRTRARRSPVAATFRVGIEEEFFLCDSNTLLVPSETPEALFEGDHSPLAARIGREFLQGQIEISTRPCSTIEEAKDQLRRLRQKAAAVAARHGLVILACGTHPLASWRNAVQSPKPRYSEVMDDLQMIGQRNMLCGMHVHVELPSDSDRVRLMTRMLPYVPLFIALSTSSPFWHGQRTGLKGYRLAAYDELPRTGLPELFQTEHQYQSYVSAMVRSGAIPNSSHLWWAVRPSHNYPTLELRAPDACTRLDDAIAIAALYRALLRYLYLDEKHNSDLDVVDRAIAAENKWRAQRYGVQGTFVTRSGPTSVKDFLDQLLDRILRVAAAEVDPHISHCRAIVDQGTSADRQLAIFERTGQKCAEIALQNVLKWLRDTTVEA